MRAFLTKDSFTRENLSFVMGSFSFKLYYLKEEGRSSRESGLNIIVSFEVSCLCYMPEMKHSETQGLLLVLIIPI